MHLNEFATLELTYKSKREDPPEGKLGVYLGGGDGVIVGRAITGAVVWDLFENEGAAVCDANFVGAIATGDGADVGFEILGFFRREEGSSLWRLASAIRFATGDPRYGHLDNAIGLIEGSFDMDAYVHNYRILMPDPGPV